MKQPIEVRHDLEADAYDVRYSTAVRAKGVFVDPAGEVMADLDAAGDVIGIEVLTLDSETAPFLGAFVARHELSLPPQITNPAA